MKLCAFLIVSALASSACASSVSPTEKVVQLLSDIEGKIIKEGQAAQKVYDDFAEFCEDKSRDLQFSIKTGKAESAELSATIDKEASTSEALSAKIEDLSGAIATDEADVKAATEIREREQADFAAEESELVEVIGMLERASNILQREMQKGGASMLQFQNANNVADALRALVQAAVFSSADASRLTALLQSSQTETSDADDADVGAPDAAVYKGQSGGIIATLNGLLEKANSQLDSARSTETANKQNFEMLKQSLTDQIRFGEKDMADAKTNLAASGENKAAAEGDLAVTSKALAADTSELGSLHQECMTKSEEFEASTKSRGEELKACGVAKKAIIDSTSGASDITYGLNQVSFLQLSTRNIEVVRFVRDLARKQGSTALAQLASRMASAAQLRFGDDVFAKIKGLISDMLEKLEAEAAEDATLKAFCDKEFKESNAKKADNAAQLAKLTSKLDVAKARSAQLKEEVAQLQKELADLASSQASMDKLRAEEKALFNHDKPEMEAGLEGVKIALKVLREYYAKGDKAHTANEGGASGVVGLLEVIEADFSQGLAGMSSTEQTAAADYDRQTKENAVTNTMKTQDVKYKTKEHTSLDKKVAELSSDRDGVQAEQDAVLQYLKKLGDQCTSKVESYAERKARREAELEGLKEALQILSTEAAMLLQRTSSRQLRGVRVHA